MTVASRPRRLPSISQMAEQVDLPSDALRRRIEPAMLMCRGHRLGRLRRNSACPRGTASRSTISVAHDVEMYSAECLSANNLCRCSYYYTSTLSTNSGVKFYLFCTMVTP
jgi:hypothetical protein